MVDMANVVRSDRLTAVGSLQRKGSKGTGAKAGGKAGRGQELRGHAPAGGCFWQSLRQSACIRGWRGFSLYILQWIGELHPMVPLLLLTHT